MGMEKEHGMEDRGMNGKVPLISKIAYGMGMWDVISVGCSWETF